MASILDTTWTIQAVTEHAPFKSGTVVEITPDAKVKFDGNEWPGSYDESKNKVTVDPQENVLWEFVASETQEAGDPPEKLFVMYGCSWTKTKPDAMGAWAADPQGTP